MKKFVLAPFLTVAILAISMSSALAEDVKITGEAACAKCALNLTSDCQNAITVTGVDGKKEVYLVEQNALSKAFHQVVCQDPAKVKAEGNVSEKNGQKVITLTKIDETK